MTTSPEGPEPVDLDALGYLQGVYQGRIIADHARMKAAIACLPFEKPKLSKSVNAHIGMGTRMEEGHSQRLERYNVAKLEEERVIASVRATHPHLFEEARRELAAEPMRRIPNSVQVLEAERER